MKIFISVDMEGISGVVHWNQTEYGKEDYERFRKLMTLEARAAVEAAFASGAQEVVVNDSHNNMRNIIVEDLPPDVKLISGSNKPMSMMEGIGPDFDAVFFIGYHSRASSLGVLNHTYTGRVAHYWVDGKIMGETGMNALIAGYYGVPVVLVSGDSEVTAEAKDLLGKVETVTVKEPKSQFSALCLHPEKSRAMIREAVARALGSLSDYKPLVPSAPSTVRLQFHTSGQADGASIMPGARRVDPVTVEFTGKDYLEAYRGARTMMKLALV
ncbi:MAG TPA: M55 family metallopeptidase [Firmicutes bacterium]|nr:M55 family metallopeptidase [Candidatus Fermentithermobacillaceae bacterium]